MFRMVIDEKQVKEWASKRYARFAVAPVDGGLLVAHVDVHGVIRLTVTQKPVTISLQAATADRVGLENAP